MSMTTLSSRKPRASALPRDVALRNAGVEYGRLADLLASLSPEEWRLPTECPGWDVRAMAGHCLGMARMAGSLREMARQIPRSEKAAKASGRLPIDELTAIQVEDTAALSTDDLVTQLRAQGPRSVAGRRRIGRLLGPVTFKQDIDGEVEKWRLGYLIDTILTRDPWMHRVDISRATGRQLHLTPEHDGVMVADVVREWADRHGRPFELVLTGPAGGRWTVGTDGERHELDAVQFCRTVSGRAAGDGLLATPVPF